MKNQSDTTVGKGSCLCGKVKVTANSMSRSVGTCHCSMCRKWTGGPMMAVDCGTDVVFEGEKNIKAYDSSAWAERGFCTSCGNHLFYRLKESNQYIMAVGIFENDESLVFDHQLFIDEKPNYYFFLNETHNMTGAEVFAKYAPD